MRIFYAAQATPNERDLPGSRLWYVNLYLPLKDLGHDLVPFENDYLHRGYDLDLARKADREMARRCRPEFGERLIDAVQAAHEQKPIQVFFSYFSSAHIEPGVIRAIRDMGIVTVNWYCNASYQFHLIEDIAPAYDFCLVPEKQRLEDYRRVGANPLYCQEAGNPNVYKPSECQPKYDVTFVGQRYGNRSGYVRSLIDAGVDVRVWGPRWREMTPFHRRIRTGARRLVRGEWPIFARDDVPLERCGAPLSDYELVRMYSLSKISLGFTAIAGPCQPGQRPLKQVRLRDFEATMSGAFYLVERFDELTEFFEPDQEIVFFDSPEELIDKATYYLRHDQARERIRQAGMQRARSEHTWHRRFERAFRQMGLG